MNKKHNPVVEAALFQKTIRDARNMENVLAEERHSISHGGIEIICNGLGKPMEVSFDDSLGITDTQAAIICEAFLEAYLKGRERIEAESNKLIKAVGGMSDGKR